MIFTEYLKKPEQFVKSLSNLFNINKHVILYGPENSGKYTQALNIVKYFSKTNLKYSRKIELELNNTKYYFNISDIHFEIDFELLGTNQFNIWIEYIQLINSIIDTQDKGIVICKNYHFIKDELLTIFHTFLRDPKLKFILCSKHISYFPKQLKEKCIIHNLKKIQNIISYSLQYKCICNKIIECVISQSNDLLLLRELIYSLFTYNFDIHECLMYIFFELIKQNYIKKEQLSYLFKKHISILKYYNTNYRPIYHLELFILELYDLRECTNMLDKNNLIENV